MYVSASEEKIVAELPFLELRWYPWLFEFYLNKMTKIIPALAPISTPSTQVDVHCEYERKVPHAFERFRDFCKTKVYSHLPVFGEMAWGAR